MLSIAHRSSVIISLVVLSALGSATVSADTIGPLSPTGAANIPLIGDAWSTPESSIGSDDVRATATTTSAFNITDILALTFSTGIPAGATIDGVEVFVEGQNGGSASQPELAVVGSVDGGITFGAFLPTPFSLTMSAGSDSITTYGGPSDDWGGISAADLNNTLFRIGILATDTFAAFTDTYSVDDVSMTVHFTPAAASLPISSRLTIIVTVLSMAIAGAFGVWHIRRRTRAV